MGCGPTGRGRGMEKSEIPQVMPRCSYCVTGDKPLLIGTASGWVQAYHGATTTDYRYFVIAAICDEWNRFVDTDPEGRGR